MLYQFVDASAEDIEAFKKTLDEAVAKVRYFDLTTSSDVYNSNTTFVVVHGLKSIEASSGFNEILNEDKDTDITKDLIAISSQNYQVIQIHKNLEAYLKLK